MLHCSTPVWYNEGERFSDTRLFWARTTRRKIPLSMDKNRRIRLSTMEIVLLVVLAASLALGLLQAYQQSRLDDARERLLRAADQTDNITGEQ